MRSASKGDTEAAANPIRRIHGSALRSPYIYPPSQIMDQWEISGLEQTYQNVLLIRGTAKAETGGEVVPVVCNDEIHSTIWYIFLFFFNFNFPNIHTHSLNSAASDFVFLTYGLYIIMHYAK